VAEAQRGVPVAAVRVGQHLRDRLAGKVGRAHTPASGRALDDEQALAGPDLQLLHLNLP
jgi:hypothetical protein